MNPEGYRSITCPYCGETHEVAIDTSAGAQDYIEDCQVCCRPIELALAWSDGEWMLEARRDDD
ncbi:MAG: CPXCG motif-containing cysteine-rich protein [Gammaproteobacteria bacterium]|nr:CPXCG motif-containing cysteine-rich protein [Gammaproteobacteria bacterium]